MMDSYILDFKTIGDPRGALTAVEGAQDIPFEIKRIFYMHHVSSDRGGACPYRYRPSVNSYSRQIESETVQWKGNGRVCNGRLHEGPVYPSPVFHRYV